MSYEGKIMFGEVDDFDFVLLTLSGKVLEFPENFLDFS